ncbi:Na+/H+ antiporter subunit E [Ruania suaedae]|uniref:Na+/H+ antiporter subunit E n=1 Tax=Ruania suaedae TaxID=2897774 RepID=UPI001E5FDFB4|nr:Na+/H+ antiporter subunit E [Ruania suaedae]UFU02763.1 Na+/H+ antiporter subunit E [Ruania suaedae]
MSASGKWERLSQWPMAVWMTIVWVLLWGGVTPANVLSGLVVSALLLVIFPMPKVGFAGRWSVIGTVALLVRLLADIVRASIAVAVRVLRVRQNPRGAVIRVQLRSESDLVLTLTAELTSLVPGTLVVEAHRLTGMLYLHVLDVSQPGALERARASVLSQERRVMHALATDADIAIAGIAPRPWKRSATKEANR